MIVDRYTIREVVEDRALEQKIIDIADKYSTFCGFKRNKGLPRNNKTFDIVKLIEVYTKQVHNSSRQDFRGRYELFLKQLIEVKNKIERNKMRNECLKLIGDDIMKYENETAADEMVLYMKCEEYKIWVDTKAHRFRIQMAGKELDSVAYDVAADAISEAHKKCKPKL